MRNFFKNSLFRFIELSKSGSYDDSLPRNCKHPPTQPDVSDGRVVVCASVRLAGMDEGEVP